MPSSAIPSLEKESAKERIDVTLNSNLRYRVVGIGDQYHWLDRKTNEPLTDKNGHEARFDSLDAAIQAFIEGRLSADRNEALTP